MFFSKKYKKQSDRIGKIYPFKKGRWTNFQYLRPNGGWSLETEDGERSKSQTQINLSQNITRGPVEIPPMKDQL